MHATRSIPTVAACLLVVLGGARAEEEPVARVTDSKGQATDLTKIGLGSELSVSIDGCYLGVPSRLLTSIRAGGAAGQHVLTYVTGKTVTGSISGNLSGESELGQFSIG
jgi:hypothetical protein